MTKKTFHGPFLSASVTKANDGPIDQVDKVKGNLGQFLSRANLHKKVIFYLISEGLFLCFYILFLLFALS